MRVFSWWEGAQALPLSRPLPREGDRRVVNDPPGRGHHGQPRASGQVAGAAGHQVIEAADGAAGVVEALANRPDVVLMDLSLSGMDGWEALRRLRADGRPCGLGIMALTAHAMSGTPDDALAAAFDGYLSKRIDAVTFADTVSRFAAEKRR